jgi:hypothetical protein
MILQQQRSHTATSRKLRNIDCVDGSRDAIRIRMNMKIDDATDVLRTPNSDGSR